MNAENRPVLVTGGTGKAGRRVAERLVPAAVVSLIRHPFIEVPDGRNAHLAAGVEGGALGRLPRDFRDYARATAERGVWTR